MPTIAELVKNVNEKNEKLEAVIEENRNDEALRKMNKVRRLSRLCKDGYRVGFIVHTPGTSSGRLVHAVQMIGGEVKKTEEGNYIITGIDLELSLTQEVIDKAKLSKRAVLVKDFDSKQFRSYRIDRILDGTITYS